jgi:hypothetical protein
MTNPSNAGNPTMGANYTVSTPVGPAPGSAPTVTPSSPLTNTEDPIALMASLLAQPGDGNAGQASTPTPPAMPTVPTWIWLLLAGALGFIFLHAK